MPILVVLAFVVGVWLLQQQSSLPFLSLWLWLLSTACLFIFVLFKATQFSRNLKRAFILLVVSLFGFFMQLVLLRGA